MFQVLFPLQDKGDLEMYQSVMPAGWEINKTARFNEWAIIPIGRTEKIGHCVLWPRKLVLAIAVDETEPEGKRFWEDFSRKYKDLDPFLTFWGIVYPAATVHEGVYELVALSNEETPTDDDLQAVAHYAKLDHAYFVKFYRGNWCPEKYVEVISYEEIRKDGCLGPKLSNWTFDLLSA